MFAIWSSFLKLEAKDLLGESKTTKKWEDRDEDQNTWGDDNFLNFLDNFILFAQEIKPLIN